MTPLALLLLLLWAGVRAQRRAELEEAAEAITLGGRR